MKPPVWLLDIDGVVNAFTRNKPPTHAWPADVWREVKAQDGASRSWRILAADPVLDFLRQVHESGRAEIRWHSTWQERSLDVGDQLGLPTFGVAHAPEFDDNKDFLRRDKWWKVPAVRRVLADEGRAVVWTDDDAGTDLSTAERTELASLGRLLVIAPDHMTGLCKKHLRMIDEFLTANHAEVSLMDEPRETETEAKCTRGFQCGYPTCWRGQDGCDFWDGDGLPSPQPREND